MKAKKLITLIVYTAFAISAGAQDFDKNLATARTSYSSGDLGNTRFAMEQMLANLDAAIGKEILTILPTAMGTLNYNQKDDNVTGGGGGIGAGLYVHRTYGTAAKTASIDIINNSPMIASINMVLNTPVVGNMMHNENQKVVKVQGYKSILQKNEGSSGGPTGYEVQIPFNNTLLTFRMSDTNETEIQQLANTIQLAKIAKMAQ